MTQTAGLAVTYFDRFLSATGGSLAKNRVQIVALTCTLLAAKYSEIKMPALKDLCEVAHGRFQLDVDDEWADADLLRGSANA